MLEINLIRTLWPPYVAQYRSYVYFLRILAAAALLLSMSLLLPRYLYQALTTVSVVMNILMHTVLDTKSDIILENSFNEHYTIGHDKWKNNEKQKSCNIGDISLYLTSSTDLLFLLHTIAWWIWWCQTKAKNDIINVHVLTPLVLFLFR